MRARVLSEMHQRWQRANATTIGDRPLFVEDEKKDALRDIMRDWEKQMSEQGHGAGHDAASSEMRAGGAGMAAADAGADLTQDAAAGGRIRHGVREDGGARSAGGADVEAGPSRPAAAAGAEEGRPGGASSSNPDGPARGDASVAAGGDGREPVKRKRGRPKGSKSRSGTAACVERRDETAGRRSTSKKIRVEKVDDKDGATLHEFPSVTDAADKSGISKGKMSTLIRASPNGSINTKDGFRYRKKHSGLVPFCRRLCAVQAMRFSSKRQDVCALSKTLTWPHPDATLSSRVEESQRSERKRKMPGTCMCVEIGHTGVVLFYQSDSGITCTAGWRPGRAWWCRWCSRLVVTRRSLYSASRRDAGLCGVCRRYCRWPAARPSKAAEKTDRESDKAQDFASRGEVVLRVPWLQRAPWSLSTQTIPSQFPQSRVCVCT